MSATIKSISDGILTLQVSGELKEADLLALQGAIADVIRAEGKLSVLVLAQEFEGWEQAGSWDDFSFQEKYDSYIEKMAIVGDTRWEDLALIFVAKGLRSFPIEYFASSELDSAQAWLQMSA